MQVSVQTVVGKNKMLFDSTQEIESVAVSVVTVEVALEYRMRGIVYVFLQEEDGLRVLTVTGVQTCALPIGRCPAGGGRGGRWKRRPRPVPCPAPRPPGSSRRARRSPPAPAPAARASGWRRGTSAGSSA